jgi:hypothetical protein
MSLPKISHPTYNIKVPSLNKNYKFRPFLVKEEKILLMAKESDKEADIFSAIKQIVNVCSLDDLNVDKLAIFDLEYLFLKIRAFSIENIIKVSYKDLEDNKNYDFTIDLNEIEVKFPEKIVNNIKITENMGIIMKYPSASIYDDKEFLDLDKDYLFELIIRCVDKIYEEDTIFEAKDYSRKEIGDFLENLDSKTFASIQEFLVNSPKLEHVIKYKNSFDNEREITLNSLNDFFTLR